MAERNQDKVGGASLNTLPTEPLLEITDLLRKRCDFFALIMTNHRFRSLLERTLYMMDSNLKFGLYKSLKVAASRGDLVIARKLLDYGCHLEGTYYKLNLFGPFTAINLAMEHGHLAMVTVLATAGANVDLARNEHDRPVFCTLREGWTEIFRVLISIGKADVNVVDEHGYGLLTTAAYYDNMEAIRYLLSVYPRYTEPSEAVSSPFHQAIYNNNYDMFMFFLKETQCSPTLLSEERRTPLETASEWGRIAFVNALLDDGRANGQSTALSNGNAVLRAFRNGHYGTTTLLLTHRNPCRPHKSVFIEACKEKDEFLAWRAFLLSDLPDAVRLEWRSCAPNNGLVNLAAKMTDHYNLDSLLAGHMQMWCIFTWIELDGVLIVVARWFPVAALVEAGADINKWCGDSRDCPLFRSLTSDPRTDPFKIQPIVGNDNLTVLNFDGPGLLTVAAGHGNFEATRFLLSLKSRLSDNPLEKCAPFHAALHNHAFLLFSWLLRLRHSHLSSAAKAWEGRHRCALRAALAKWPFSGSYRAMVERLCGFRMMRAEFYSC
ncbi:hypothetical protein LLEC1_02078 [Akanthomyces lecanii]|uniref:Uncharacterized protein n=1 Tax=Cordyceps confragosa TaxID=2714763 RepID=A0A179I950_CORDF|nr:hypothetical protein LLEC1_02078 [Akanthomyces lecanii]